MQKRTVSIKLTPTEEQSQKLYALQKEFSDVRNAIVEIAVENKCFNQFTLHNIAYYKIRQNFKLGSQMTCIAIKSVCSAYKAALRRRNQIPKISFRSMSVHFDKRTYTLNKDYVSLYTLSKRIKISYKIGEFQKNYIEKGISKEAELIRKRKGWYLNLVLDLPDVPPCATHGEIIGVDLGENNIACTSNGKIFSGRQLRYERDKALALRARLQSNGTKSSKRFLKKVSGKEARHVKDVNHCVSKSLVSEAVTSGCNTIAMEDLANIRSRIKGGKRMRSRLHRWPWAQLQNFVEYKARMAGINTVFVNPAFTSQTCSRCGQLGIRDRHHFECSNCVIFLHSDVNAALNIRKIAESNGLATGAVNRRNVASNIFAVI